MIKSQAYPNHSDVDWEEYVDWASRGHGDEWFLDCQEEEDEDDEMEETPRPGLDAWSRMVRCIINGQRQTPIMATDI